MSTCCFFGHRKIEATEELKRELRSIIENLMIKEKVDTFLFGSKSEFNSLCRQIVNELKEIYPDIKRVYFSIYPPSGYDQLPPGTSVSYEEIYHPEGISDAGRATYVERNYAMIDQSEFCIVYNNEAYEVPNGRRRNIYLPEPKRNSGTKVAFEYATTKKKSIINVFERIK